MQTMIIYNKKTIPINPILLIPKPSLLAEENKVSVGREATTSTVLSGVAIEVVVTTRDCVTSIEGVSTETDSMVEVDKVGT